LICQGDGLMAPGRSVSTWHKRYLDTGASRVTCGSVEEGKGKQSGVRSLPVGDGRC